MKTTLPDRNELRAKVADMLQGGGVMGPQSLQCVLDALDDVEDLRSVLVEYMDISKNVVADIEDGVNVTDILGMVESCEGRMEKVLAERG